jgi:hypothetical protein
MNAPLIALFQNDSQVGPSDFPSLHITLPSDVGLVKGAFAQLIAEVMLDGTEHPHPYARLPAIGPFSGYRILNSLGRQRYFVGI